MPIWQEGGQTVSSTLDYQHCAVYLFLASSTHWWQCQWGTEEDLCWANNKVTCRHQPLYCLITAATVGRCGMLLTQYCLWLMLICATLGLWWRTVSCLQASVINNDNWSLVLKPMTS